MVVNLTPPEASGLNPNRILAPGIPSERGGRLILKDSEANFSILLRRGTLHPTKVFYNVLHRESFLNVTSVLF